MNKFQQLIETLQTELVIMIDDDFTPVTDAEEMLTYICFMNPVDQNLMLQRLGAIDNTLIAPLNALITGVRGIELHSGDDDFIEAGLLAELLNSKSETELCETANEVIESLNKSERKTDVDELIMMYGLRPSAGTENYNGFFEGLKGFSPKKSVRLYKGLEGREFTNFENEIRAVNQARDNKFPLLIVDRYLANNQDGNQIIQNLRENDNGINRFFSVFYTSIEAEQLGGTGLDSYFQLQLNKKDNEAVKKVSEAFALSAFVTFFDQIYRYREDALRSANELVIESGMANMLYLAGMANAEGDTVFNTFNKWFDLLSSKKVQDELLKDDPEGFDLNFLISLTSLINSDFITTIAGNADLDQQFHQEIQQLATFEIFDLKINNFCSAPASGDIFDIDDQLYMLAGQECDLIVRSNGAATGRNENLAELIKCSFKPVNQDSKIESKESRISVNHFTLNDTKGILEIHLSKKEYFDFRLLDLTSLNADGVSRFATDGFPKSRVMKLLPAKWTWYVPGLVKELNDKLKVQKFIADEDIALSSITGDLSFSIQYEEDNDTVAFPVKRLARMKGAFREYVLQRYWQYKTRRGLNTIGVYKRNVVTVESILAGYAYDLQDVPGEHHAWLQLTGDRKKNSKKASLDLVLMTSGLSKVIDPKFKPYIDHIENTEIVIPAKREFIQNGVKITKKWDQDNVSLKVIFPLYNELSDHTIAVKDKYKLHDLFGKDFVRSNPSVKKAILVNENGQTRLMGDTGALHNCNLEVLVESEIHLPDENIKLAFDKENGKLYTIGPIKKDEGEEA